MNAYRNRKRGGRFGFGHSAESDAPDYYAGPGAVPRIIERMFHARWTADVGLRCEVPRDANRGGPINYGDASAPEHHPDHHAAAPVTCWCEAEVVSVPLDLVRAGLTFACDTDRCRAIENAALATEAAS